MQLGAIGARPHGIRMNYWRAPCNFAGGAPRSAELRDCRPRFAELAVSPAELSTFSAKSHGTLRKVPGNLALNLRTWAGWVPSVANPTRLPAIPVEPCGAGTKIRRIWRNCHPSSVGQALLAPPLASFAELCVKLCRSATFHGTWRMAGKFRGTLW